MADAGGGEVAGDAVDAEAVGPVGRDVHVEHRIVQPGIIGVGRADRRIVGKLDDPGMVLAELKLARRAHHAAALDPADRGDLQGHVGAGDVGAGRAEHAEHAGAGVGRAADDLDRLARTVIDGQHLQLVGLRMLFRSQHPRHAERRQRFGRIVDPLDLQPDVGQRVGDRCRIGVGVEPVA